MIPIKYKNGVTTTVATLSVFQLGGLVDTPIDPELETRGGWIEFPISLVDYSGRRVDKVWFPPFGSIREGTVILLSDIQIDAQFLLMACEEFNSGTIKEEILNKFFLKYQKTIMKNLFGRGGFISQYVMCNRMRKSGRAVLLPMRGGSPMWCEIPSWMMKALHLKNGDLIIVGRDPTIWEGGIECLKVRGINEDVIRLHPLLFSQLNADCDGDQVWCLAVPSHLKEEMLPYVGSFMVRHAEWPIPWNKEGMKINWTNVSDTLMERSCPDGFSIGPEDIMYQTAELVKAEEILGKELAEECLETATNMTFDRWQDIIKEVNLAMLKMKIGMGPVGAAAMNLKVLAGESAMTIKSAGMMGERIEQLLLDAKQAKDKGGPQFSADDILELLNRKAEYSDIEEKEAVTASAAMLGLKPSHVRPMIKIIWNSKLGLSQLVRENFPWFAATTQAAENDDVAIGIALQIFRNGETDPTGTCRFVIDGLAKLANKRDINITQGIENVVN